MAGNPVVKIPVMKWAVCWPPGSMGQGQRYPWQMWQLQRHPGSQQRDRGERKALHCPGKKVSFDLQDAYHTQNISSTGEDSASQVRKMEAAVFIPVSKGSLKHKECASS